MYHFFVDPGQIGPTDIAITGSDVNHIRNVLRMQPGEQITVSSGEDEKEYRCEIRALSEEEVTAHIMWVEETGAELPSRISLFQGLPKADKMELVIQKAVELGAYELVPMATRRAVVKLDAKRGGKAQTMECNFRERGEAVKAPDYSAGAQCHGVSGGGGLCGVPV